MYLNGVMVKAVPGITGGIGLQAVVNYRRVGTYSSASQPLLGKIDELRLSQATQINTDFLSPYDDTLKGTVGLWHMDSAVGSSVSDDDSVALTPRGNDMDYVGPVQLVSPSAYPAGNSQFANAAQFNGYSSYLEAGQITGFDQDNVRVECWAKLHLANLDPLRIYVNMSAGKFYFNVVPIKTNNLAAPKVACEVPDLIDNWVHLAVEYLKSTDTMKLFVNGRLCSTYVALTEGSGLRNLSQKRIGTYSPTSYVFWGWIDDFRITNAVMPELVCGDLGYVPADLNEDCFVDIVDLEILVSDWLESTMPQ
jgi:hypothetical protein